MRQRKKTLIIIVILFIIILFVLWPKHHSVSHVFANRICEEISKECTEQYPPLKINIVIPSMCGANGFIERYNQRNSWIKYSDKSGNTLWNELYSIHSKCEFQYKYYIGNGDDECNKKLEQENKKFNDIIRMNLNESWSNLPKKTIRMIIKEYNVSSNLGFLLKTDTDSYVNLPNLCNGLIELKHSEEWNEYQDVLYIGKLWKRNLIDIIGVSRYGNKQWSDFLGHIFYTPFMAGSGYVISNEAVEIIYDSFKNHIQHLGSNIMEDAFIGHFLSGFDTKYIDLSAKYALYQYVTSESIYHQHVDHGYKGKESVQMITKYNLHRKLAQQCQH